MTSKRRQQTKAALARAFRETVLSLVGVYQVFEVDLALSEATAEVLGNVFRRHLRGSSPATGPSPQNPLHALADKLEKVASGASGTGPVQDRIGG